MYNTTTGSYTGGYECGSCGQWVLNGTTHLCPGHQPYYPPVYPVAPGNYGWICPKCGRVNSPTKPTCDCSLGTYPYYPYVTWTSGTINIKDNNKYVVWNGYTEAGNDITLSIANDTRGGCGNT